MRHAIRSRLPGGLHAISAAYIVAAFAWILGSGFLVEALVSDSHQPRVEMLKGIAFVAVTGTVLHLLLRRHERHLSQALLQTKRVANFAEFSPHPIAELDADGHVTYSNQALRRASLTSGILTRDLLPQQTPHIVAQSIREQSHQDDVPHDVRGQHWRWSFFPVRDPDAVFAYGTDRTNEAQLQLRLEHTSRMEAAAHLAAGTAHDINNVLTAMSGHCSLLAMRTPIDDPRQEDIEGMRLEVQRAAGIARTLASIGRSGQSTVELALVDLAALCSDSVATMRRMLPRDVQLHLHLTASPLYVRIDTQECERMLLNLIANAIDAVGSQGAIWFRLFANPGDACLEVRDSGRGIPQDILPRIFDPYFTTKAHGTGLGLASTHAFVTRSRGRIEVESFPGQGSTFRIVFPRLADPVAAQQAAQSPAA